MLASTVQFSSYDRLQHPHPSAYPPRTLQNRFTMDGSTERYQPAVPRTRPTPTGADRVRSDPEDHNLPAVPSGPNSVPDRPPPQQQTVPTRTPEGVAAY